MTRIKSLEETPENCTKCPYGIYLGSISFCSILGDDEIDIQENMLEGTRYEYCPLVEIEENTTEKLDKIRQIYRQWAEIGDNADCWAFSKIGKVLDKE